jgi:hypothetical protein
MNNIQPTELKKGHATVLGLNCSLIVVIKRVENFSQRRLTPGRH